MVKTEVNGARPNPQTARLCAVVPWLLALFFGVWALRGLDCQNVIHTDAARHAMNGVFLRDLVRTGHISDPLSYGKQYFAHLPALSMPFHPPLFPAIESVFFGVLGVSLFSARLTVALATGLCVLLLYRLIFTTLQSHWIAIATILTFFSWKDTQYLASDVMLEFPALVFTLSALLVLRRLPSGYTVKHALWFGLLAGAAVWTKQQTAFLGVVPFVYIGLLGQWPILRGKAIWCSSILFGIIVFGLMRLSAPLQNTGIKQVAQAGEAGHIFFRNFRFYMDSFMDMIGPMVFTFLLGACIAAVVWPRLREGEALKLFAAWAVCAFFLLLVIGPYDRRYLFFVYPALFVIGFAILMRAAGLILPRSRVWVVPAVAGTILCAVGLVNTPRNVLHGPEQLASYLVSDQPRRILYCGTTVDGSFVFSVRMLDADLRTVVIQADKLPTEAHNPAELERFASRLGITHVVVERTERDPQWTLLRSSPPASFLADRVFALSSSNPRNTGELEVYRFSKPSGMPDQKVTLAIPRVGKNLDLPF